MQHWSEVGRPAHLLAHHRGAEVVEGRVLRVAPDGLLQQRNGRGEVALLAQLRAEASVEHGEGVKSWVAVAVAVVAVVVVVVVVIGGMWEW